MQELISDFYKRFSQNGNRAEYTLCPACIILFGTKDMPHLSFKLTFGAHAAFRSRSDGRIVLSRTDNDTAESINKINIENYCGAKWAEDIFKCISHMPQELGGAEILLHTDTGLPNFSPRTLCAAKAMSILFAPNQDPKRLIFAADAPVYMLPSLIDGKKRFFAIDPFSQNYTDYEFPLWGYKAIIAKIKPKPAKAFSRSFLERERKRLTLATSALLCRDFSSLSNLMQESSKDMLSENGFENINSLFGFAEEFTNAVRVLHDFSGIIALVQSEQADEFTMLLGDRQEKKSGMRPDFYISN